MAVKIIRHKGRNLRVDTRRFRPLNIGGGLERFNGIVPTIGAYCVCGTDLEPLGTLGHRRCGRCGKLYETLFCHFVTKNPSYRSDEWRDPAIWAVRPAEENDGS